MADTPIRSLDEDRLERRPFAERIANRIDATRNGPSVVFGLAGPWGSGKTSVLHMVEEILERDDQYRDVWTVVTFAPWSAADTDGLTDEFYRAIAEAMPQTDAGNTARKLLKAAAPTVAAVSKVALTKAAEKYLGEGAVRDMATAGGEAIAEQLGSYDFDVQPDPFVNRFTKISTAIRKTGKTVLVIVDDLDRLHADELLSVMKAVRLLGRFDRVHYLLSYDDTTVVDILEQTDLARHSRSRARDYLEKIIQYPFVLPPIQESHLADELRTCMEQVAQNHCLSIAPPDGHSLDAASYVRKVIPHRTKLTLRSIYRLFNQADVLITLVGPSEIHLIDATLITALRLRHPDLYHNLPRWQHDLLSSSTSAKATEQDWRTRITETTGLKSDKDVDEVYQCLVALFPKMEHPPTLMAPRHPRSCRISDRNYFDRYFAFRIPTDDISDDTVRTEYQHLLDHGTWPDNSAVLPYIVNDNNRNNLVRTKLEMHNDLIDEATSPQSAAAAIALTTSLAPEEPSLRFFEWTTVLHPLLRRAVCTASTPTEAEQIVLDYRTTCGLVAITELLAHPPYISPAAELAQIEQATTSIHNEVLDIVVDDLTTDRTQEQRRLNSVLTFLDYLDHTKLWPQLRDRIDPMLDTGTITQGDLAARFVSIYSNDEIGEFRVNEFDKLIPRASWRADQFSADTTTTLHDTTLASCAIHAARQVRKILDAQAAQQANPAPPP
ncbi:KAP family P-loop NTPase fold protein [Rhodococcus pyridinivorans]|uniref:KAP family P-loop NTPase fold protein n=1 Tax=Rhodococcus pyridinivorans TaxID=103816 RepID=UPI002078F2C1|nr:P-loop NTPase fold protein [Rhodococcus pyridinivorans]USI93109.1 KAP family NTPase [Rhodococcus pyridinivorans]